MRTPTKRTRFSKRRSRRKTSFPLVAVVQKRSQPYYRSAGSLNSRTAPTSERESSQLVGPSSQSVKKSRGTIDYKNVVLLRKLITAEGKILPRRINKLTAKQQRYSSKAIKSARIVGLLPFINWSRSFNVEYKPKSSR